MTDPTAAFAKMVPGFDFLQGLVKNAGAALPGVGQWLAPTLDPEAIEKRISELRTVQFWLEQNARLLGTTIQALEVQRMTLSTLKTMNVSFADLTESLKIRLPGAAAPAAPAPTSASPANPVMTTAPAPAASPAATAAATPPTTPAGVVDPMQWWGALTQQFTELAANAMKDSSAGALVQQGLAAAGETMKKASTMPLAVAQGAASAAQSLAGAAVKQAAKPEVKATTRPAAGKTSARKTSARKSG